MSSRLKAILKILLSPCVCVRRRFIFWKNAPERQVKKLYAYDCALFMKHSGALHCQTREQLLAKIILSYHVVEKGLTMPRRRLDFGHGAVLGLIGLVRDFEQRYGTGNPQVEYAIGVVLEYKKVHGELGCQLSDENFRCALDGFCRQKCAVPPSPQLLFTRESFFGNVEAPFPEFAKSRHSCRHFEGVVADEVICRAVELAMTTPSACNRQHWRVHCISDHGVRDAIFDIQKGKENRGFGEDADKLLVVTSDLQDLQWIEERNDVFVNGGMFLMNLSYSLHYFKVAHCILNGSVSVDGDQAIHRRANIPLSERVVGMVACGNAPLAFPVAPSKRKDYKTILTFHGEGC